MDDDSEVEIEYEDSSDGFESDDGLGGAFGAVPASDLSQGDEKVWPWSSTLHQMCHAALLNVLVEHMACNAGTLGLYRHSVSQFAHALRVVLVMPPRAACSAVRMRAVKCCTIGYVSLHDLSAVCWLAWWFRGGAFVVVKHRCRPNPANRRGDRSDLRRSMSKFSRWKICVGSIKRTCVQYKRRSA